MASAEHIGSAQAVEAQQDESTKHARLNGKSRDKDAAAAKRRCVSTACIACRRRKSKCDGNLPSCAACASVYGTECVYDPNSDHRRKGVYKKDIDNLKTRNTTLQTLVHGILSYPEEEVWDLVRDIRSCDSLDDIAEGILARDLEAKEKVDAEELQDGDEVETNKVSFEKELSGKMGGLHLEDGAVRFIGGTSNLLFHDTESSESPSTVTSPSLQQYVRQEDAVRSWTTVNGDAELILHLLNMYFSWHYQYFTTLSKYMFFQDFFRGKPVHGRRKNEHCTSLLVNAMLALGCHFTAWPAACADPRDSATAGDHFFKEAKRLIMDNDEFEHPRLATVQALALMSVREAGCGREAKGWVYSGMSFRMACDLGLNVKSGCSDLDEYEIDARRITFWGCFLFDKCWSNYLGRPPQLPLTNITVAKFDVFPVEDAEPWSPWTDNGLDQSYQQPSRTRAVALLTSTLCEISNDILLTFYRPGQVGKVLNKQAEIKRLSEFHTRLEAWRKQLPKELEPREGQLPHVLLMNMFFNLLFIHLFRPFLKYSYPHGPLPPQVQPRRICTQAAAMISKILRLYKRTHGLRRICNVAVYIVHSACTIHILNLPDKDAKRDIIHGVRHLEEIADGWLCARRTLLILGTQARKWRIELPEEAMTVLQRAEEKYGSMPSPSSSNDGHPSHQFPSMDTQPATNPLNATDIANAAPDARWSTDQSNDPSYQPHTFPPAANGGIGSAGDLPNGPSVSIQPPNVGLVEQQLSAVDSKEWWLKDQSAFFDSWSIRSGSATVTSTSDPFQSAHDLELVADGGNVGSTTEQMSIFNDISGVKEEDFTADGYDLEYLDFGASNIYGYDAANE